MKPIVLIIQFPQLLLLDDTIDLGFDDFAEHRASTFFLFHDEEGKFFWFGVGFIREDLLMSFCVSQLG